jgi:acetyl-CoA C-acetyltransferase
MRAFWPSRGVAGGAHPFDDVADVLDRSVRRVHAIGAVLTTKLIHSMRCDGLKRGIVTLCIGGGQGIALAIKTVH